MSRYSKGEVMGKTMATMMLLALAQSTALVGQREATMRVSTDGFEIEGLSAGARVAALSAGRELRGHLPMVRSGSFVASDEDGDGTLRHQPSWHVPEHTLAVAADVESGTLVLGTSVGTPVRELALDEAALRLGPDDTLDRLQLRARQVQVMVVRPGVGAWHGTVADGGRRDADRTSDALVTVALGDLAPMGSLEAAPSAFGEQDIVVLLDPHRLAVSVSVVSDDVWTREVR